MHLPVLGGVAVGVKPAPPTLSACDDGDGWAASGVEDMILWCDDECTLPIRSELLMHGSGSERGPEILTSISRGGEFSLTHDIKPPDMLQIKGKFKHNIIFIVVLTNY